MAMSRSRRRAMPLSARKRAQLVAWAHRVQQESRRGMSHQDAEQRIAADWIASHYGDFYNPYAPRSHRFTETRRSR